jgi:hypothetical protein
MRRLWLALALGIGCAASTATADYVVIVANLGRPGDAPKAKAPAEPGKAELRAGAPGGLVPPAPPPGAAGGAFRGNPGAGVPGAAPPGGPADPAAAAPPGTFDPDAVPLMTVAIIEAQKKLSNQDVLRLQMGQPLPSLVPFKVNGFEGKVYLKNSSLSNVFIIHPNNKSVLRLSEVYEAKLKELAESKTDVKPDRWIELAEWSLAHGMLDHFKVHMEKAAAADKSLPKAAAYLQMKAALGKTVENVDTAGNWRRLLLTNRYQTYTTAHYAILSDDAPSVEPRKRLLEDALQAYYYWFALRGSQLPVPTRRLVAILTREPKTFKHLQSVLDSTPVIGATFYARRENLLVMSSRRLDDAYDRLDKLASPLWGAGYSREQLLKGKGYPAKNLLTNKEEVYDAMTLALLLKVMELDAEAAGTEHGATRQLLYASGLLPPAVAAPEWVQFGVATFFETSPGSPWPTIGLPNFEYSPLYRDLGTARKLPPDQLELLKMVVTDDYFRNHAPGLKREVALRNARATAWSLAHFLIRKRLDGLLRYFKELAQLPRDVPLDESTLWSAFARAFNAVDATGQPDPNALRELADDWDKDTKLEQYDNRETEVMREIRLAYQRAATLNSAAAAARSATPGAGNAQPQAPPAVGNRRNPRGGL